MMAPSTRTVRTSTTNLSSSGNRESERLALPIASSMTCSMRRNSKREPYRSRGKQSKLRTRTTNGHSSTFGTRSGKKDLKHSRPCSIVRRSEPFQFTTAPTERVSKQLTNGIHKYRAIQMGRVLQSCLSGTKVICQIGKYNTMRPWTMHVRATLASLRSVQKQVQTSEIPLIAQSEVRTLIINNVIEINKA